MRAVPPTSPWRDPFYPTRDVQPEQPSDPKPIEDEPSDVTPLSFNMELTGTANSNQHDMAMIHAEGLMVDKHLVSRSMYAEGDTIHLVKDGEQVVFVLSNVHSRYVILRHDNRPFRLDMPDRTFPGIIRQSTGSHSPASKHDRRSPQ